MKKSNKLFKLWVKVGVRAFKIPYTINFTPTHHEKVYAIGFAWSKSASDRMIGDIDRKELVQRLAYADSIIAGLTKGTRKGRRIINRAAKKAARDITT